MADVKWIKINTDIFDDEKFTLIDSMPEADAIELIWFKLLVFAGKSNNNGLFFFNDRVAYTDEMLASVFHRPLNVVRLAMKTFEEFGMIEQIDGVYAISNWGKHQSLDAYEKKKVRDREYQQKRRSERKDAIEQKKSSDNRLTVGRDCSYSISISNSISKDSKYIDKEYIENEEIVNEEWFYITLDIYPRKDGAETAKMYWLQIMGSVVSGNRKKVALEIYRALELYLEDYLRTHEDEKKRFQYVPSLDKWMKESMNTWIREYNKNRGEEDD